MSFQSVLMRAYLLRKRRKWDKKLNGRIPPVEALRKWLAKLFVRFNMPEGVSIKKSEIEGVNGEWLIPKDVLASDEMILYLHGGGYMMGSAEIYRPFAAKLAVETRTKVLVIDYALAPENPYPAAVNDVMAVYGWLQNGGYKGGNIIIAGDSAGGGLALSTMINIREERMVQPAGAVLFSPWVDLTCSGETYSSMAKKDPLFNVNTVKEIAKYYAGKLPMDDPGVSPLFADLKGLPPILIQSGTIDIFFSDSTQLTARAKTAGVEVELDEWKGQAHVFQIAWERIPEARKSYQKISEFVRAKLGLARVMYHDVEA